MVQPDPDFEALLEHLKSTRGFDFTGYKRSSLIRRVDRRLATVGSQGYAEYLDYLELHPDEFTTLFNTILINVTGFYRDASAWEFLAEEVLPRLLETKSPSAPIRVWSAGCSSGEEPYTLAIVLAELIGITEFRDRIKIYATDVDEENLNYARQGAYTERQVAGVPTHLLEKYFERIDNRYAFRKDLRRSVIFGRNDLVQDAPISRLDLLVCRNTLMYLTAETQARVLSKFHFALADDGVLFLGKAEMLLSHGSLFVPIELRRRTFRKSSRLPLGKESIFMHLPGLPPPPDHSGFDLVRAEAMASASVAQVVLDADGIVVHINRQAEMMFAVSTREVGQPFRDLELSYRPLELRRHIEQVQAERRTLRISDITYTSGNDAIVLEVQITPLVATDSEILGVSVTFNDVTEFQRLREELGQANRQLETAYEELQSTNEELETTNEELHSTVEELETTNEELQSTNEELETMNEELHSTNDELQTINDELQKRTSELNQANHFFESILTSLRTGVVVVDSDMLVQSWNHQAHELWGLRADETIGEHFLNLDIGLPTEQLRHAIRNALVADKATTDVSLNAINRRGRTIAVRVLCSPLLATDGATVGAILTMEELDDQLPNTNHAGESDPAAPSDPVAPSDPPGP